MKIGFVSLMRVAPWGGSEELWSKTALLAVQRGIQVQSLTMYWNLESPRIKKLREAGIDTKFYQPDGRALADRVAVRLGLQKPRSVVFPVMDADVYVISSGILWDICAFRSITDYVLSKGKPYIILEHNAFEYGDIVPENLRSYAISVLEGAALRLFVSERNRQCAERQLAHSMGAYQVVNNPVSIREASIKPYPQTNKLLLASVASLDCITKGQDLLLEALSGAIWRNRDFSLQIYGRGNDEQHIRRLINFYRLQDKVTLEGHVSDVDRIWEMNQALVLSSTIEGVPMVVVEAMLAGRTVLATDVGGVERYVLEGQTGFMIGEPKAKYLSQGLEKLWANRAQLQQLGENSTAYHVLYLRSSCKSKLAATHWHTSIGCF
jgi:glycosyltransferase involved in cell wall biosynthesis